LTSERIWKQPGAEDNGVALMRADDGRWAMLHASWSEWRGYRFALDVHGSAGIARAAYGPMVASVTRIAERGGRGRTKRKLFAGVTLREKVQGWQSTVERTFGAELEDFMRRIGGEPVQSAEGFDGFRAVEIAHAVYRSEQERTEQRLSARF
jgi:predicted dehydrogenase